MFWIEIDTFSPEALGHIRRASPHPISSCETLLGLREFLPYFPRAGHGRSHHRHALERVWQSMKIAASAEAHESTWRHTTSTPPVHDDERALLSRRAEPAHHGDRHRPPGLGRRAVDHPPVFENGHLVVPDRAGWGCTPNEDAIRAHPPKAGRPGLLNYGQKK